MTPMVKRLLELAPKIGARVVLEPRYGLVAQIIFPNGVRRFFKHGKFDLNPVAATQIADDKDWASFFMRASGYPAVAGQTFYSDAFCKQIGSDRDLAAAKAAANALGYPLFVKPNSKSQGRAVCKVHSDAELEQAATAIFALDNVLLLEPVQTGSDYRIVVLDGKVLCAYRRVPLAVMGDGTHTIEQLLRIKQAYFESRNRPEAINITDFRIKENLQRTSRSLESVPAKGEVVVLLDNANLSNGGTAEDVTTVLHPDYLAMAVALTNDMGLRICGIDIMTEADITQPLGTYAIIEINALPGVDYYAVTGPAEKERVDNLYLAVLEALSQPSIPTR